MARQDFYELHLYLPPRFKELLKARAGRAHRSINAQVTEILERDLIAAGLLEADQPPPARRGAHPPAR